MHPNDTTSARRLQGWRGEALRIGFALLLLMGFRSAFANHYLVPTGSMQPTLMPGDRVLVDMRAYGYRLPFTHARLLGQGQPTRGEVAVFRSPADGERLIKRIVAVGGDRVEVRDGHLRINGRDVALGGHADVEQLGRHVYRLDLSRGGGPDAAGVVPAGQVLVMGDARGNSLDGRMFGLLPADAFYARAIAVYWRSGEGPVWQRL